MSQFNWQLDIEESWGEPEKQPPSKRPFNPVWFLVAAAGIVTVVLAGWFSARQQVARAEAELRDTIQQVLDVEHTAVLRGDGDLFFSLLADESAWHFAQLDRENLSALKAGFTVTRAQAQDGFVWANLSWQTDGRSYQRISFFQQQRGKFTHAAGDPGYWGSTLHRQTGWGKLSFSQQDEAFAALVTAFVDDQVAQLCPSQCVTGRLPFTLELMTRSRQSTAVDTVYVPSPRLVALDEDGRPAAPFWQLLNRRLKAHLTPASIRFALPPPFLPGVYRMDYAAAAEAFMDQHPDIEIELVPLAELPADLADLARYDGAAVPPTAAMIAAGLVVDLTDFAQDDPGFHPEDFYQSIWQGAHWQDRLWFVPESARIQLLYYDRLAYAQAELPEPAWQWRWADLNTDMTALMAQKPYKWGFLDLGRDSLLAYAYNLAGDCSDTAVSPCPGPLQPHHVADALDWYTHLMAANLMPSLAQQAEALDRGGTSTLQTVSRQAVFWVDEPLYFEYYLLNNPIGVAPFPGAGFLDGVTPLWVDGGFISSQSEVPGAVWQWLSFLSRQPPVSSFRQIPARPSAAADSNYWLNLPRPLVNAMRTAFNAARPVTLDDQQAFTKEQITAILSGRQTAIEAAQNSPKLVWFGVENKR